MRKSEGKECENPERGGWVKGLGKSGAGGIKWGGKRGRERQREGGSRKRERDQCLARGK